MNNIYKNVILDFVEFLNLTREKKLFSLSIMCGGRGGIPLGGRGGG